MIIADSTANKHNAVQRITKPRRLIIEIMNGDRAISLVMRGNCSFFNLLLDNTAQKSAHYLE